MNLSTREKQKELDGKRYKIIHSCIKKQKDEGIEISHEMEIDLHYSWMQTMKQLKNSKEINNGK